MRASSRARWSTLLLTVLTSVTVAALLLCGVLWAASYVYWAFVQASTITGSLPARAPGVPEYTGRTTTLSLEGGHVCLERWHFSTHELYENAADVPTPQEQGFRAGLERYVANNTVPSVFNWQHRWSGGQDWSLLGVAWRRGPSPAARGDDWELAVHFRTMVLVLILTGASLSVLLIRRLVREHRARRGACVTCGYDLRGTPAPCPECGPG